jgi:type II secretory pathway pseudopilin PulG
LQTLNSTKIQARIKDLRSKGFRATVAEHGAIDLASIMVGVIIIGILSAGIAATVFALIPFSQDKAAQQNLQAAASAQSVQFTFSSGNGAGVYVTKADLVGTTNAAGKSLLNTNTGVVFNLKGLDGATGGGDDGKTYIVYSLSQTGNVYSATDSAPTPVLLTSAQVTSAGLTVSGSTLTIAP